MGRTEDAWNEVGEQFKKLGAMFKDHYESQAGEAETITEDDIEDVVQKLGVSIKAAFGTVGEAVKDQEIHEETRHTAGSLFGAIGTTFSELGAEISKATEHATDATDAPEPPETSDG